jgi:hypothetical protein
MKLIKFEHANINVKPYRVDLNDILESLLESILVDVNVRSAFWIEHNYLTNNRINYKYVHIVKKYIPDVQLHIGKIRMNNNLIDIILVHNKHAKDIDKLESEQNSHKLHEQLGKILEFPCYSGDYDTFENQYNLFLNCKIMYKDEEYNIPLMSSMCPSLTSAKKGLKFEKNANKKLPEIKEKYKKIFKDFDFEIIEFYLVINKWD